MTWIKMNSQTCYYRQLACSLIKRRIIQWCTENVNFLGKYWPSPSCHWFLHSPLPLPTPTQRTQLICVFTVVNWLYLIYFYICHQLSTCIDWTWALKNVQHCHGITFSKWNSFIFWRRLAIIMSAICPLNRNEKNPVSLDKVHDRIWINKINITYNATMQRHQPWCLCNYNFMQDQPQSIKTTLLFPSLITFLAQRLVHCPLVLIPDELPTVFGSFSHWLLSITLFHREFSSRRCRLQSTISDYKRR